MIIGVDANPALMREISHRASRKPARGGLPNALFGQLSLEDAPGELVGLTDALTVLFPWGSLLRAVAVPEDGLRNLAALGKPGCRVHFLYGYGGREARWVEELGLPALGTSEALGALESAYAAAGLAVAARYAPREGIARVETTWAKKIAFSHTERIFVEIRGKIHG